MNFVKLLDVRIKSQVRPVENMNKVDPVHMLCPYGFF
jgi:hypothetical protein